MKQELERHNSFVQKLGLDPAKETTLQGLNSALVELPSSERRARFQEYLILVGVLKGIS